MRAERAFEPDVAHHGCNYAVAGELAAIVQIARQYKHHVIAAERLARFIDEERAIRVAVERDAYDVALPRIDEFAYALLERAQVGRPAADVDARTVVLAIDFMHARAEFAQRVRRVRVRC